VKRPQLAAGLISGIALLGAATANAAALLPEIQQLYTSVSIPPPSADQMTVCYGFVCRRRTTLFFEPADRKALTDIMKAGSATPEAERAALQKAVIWFDRRVGAMIGTDKRIARADFRYFDAAHNFDCWDTTRNAASLVLVLQDWELLRYHVLTKPRYRGNMFVGQTPHNTAVLTDKTTSRDWVVDMWPRKFAEPPDVMPLEKWLVAK
jgi:hypothetical protein